jgi:hypothetical protein
MSRTSPVLGRPAKEGNKFGGNFRNYSHLWEKGRGYSNASKGEKPAIREFLAREHAAPWFAAIADSGQKHVLMFVALNGPGRSGVVMFDEQPVCVPDSVALVDSITALLSAGVTKDEIGSREYYVRTMAERRELVERFEAEHGSERGSGWFTLALWLSQRDEEEFQRQDAARKARKDVGRQAKKAAGDSLRRDDLDPPRRVSRRAKRAASDELLEPNPGPHAEQRPPVLERERVGDADDAQASGAEPAQLGFKDFA